MGGELLKLKLKKKKRGLEIFVLKKVRNGKCIMWAEWGPGIGERAKKRESKH